VPCCHHFLDGVPRDFSAPVLSPDADAGLDVVTISGELGHASPAITLRVYGHLFRDRDARSAEIMEVAFAKV